MVVSWEVGLPEQARYRLASAPRSVRFLAIAQRQEPMGTHRHVVLRGAGPAGGSQIGGRMYFVDKGISSDPTDLHSVHLATYLFKVC